MKRRTPGGPDPIHNPGPSPVNDFIVKRQTLGGPDPIHNPIPSPLNDFIVKRGEHLEDQILFTIPVLLL
ncbi:hypothetical protein V6N11_007968 [Hibiscus sabdariffa]|uniref:Uncharacterized protein n=1 Tax=Hibiscus sabdariffa TaxID=183260 RepID=A0ABR2PZ78_9ROSI